MDNLDDKIDTLIRDKLVSFIQENAARIKRITTKFTQSNKKFTLDHWQALYDSYDKMFRAMPREMLRVEREVRLKFVSTVSEDRVIRLKTMFNTETELLIQKLAKAYQPEFERLGHGADFEARIEKSRKKLSESLDQNIQKCLDAVNGDTGQAKKATVEDLMQLYDVKETTLHGIQIVASLQTINSLLAQINGDAGLTEILENFQDGFRHMFQDIQKNRSTDVATMEARKKFKMEVARDAMTVREIVLNTEPFLEQWALPEEKRNSEIIRKSWANVFDILEGREGRWQAVIPNFKPLYEFMCGEGG
ncbi:MAG: hypothetical protein IH802_07625 [Nitrospinae bacterium]|nr:hypothetical protein [Nitrospinota bacterium]